MEIKRNQGFLRRNKKYFILPVILIVTAMAVYFAWPFVSFSVKSIKIDDVISLVQPQESGSAQKLSVPRLVIPGIGVSAYIQNVGTDKDGNMGVPDNMQDVGWYKNGASYGEAGNAVIAGHVSSWRGPAVFASLKDLKKGDEIYVITKDNLLQRFAVIDKQDYEVDNAPLQKIFGATNERKLNLITCSGGWNWREQEFNKRLVVYAKFIDQEQL